MMTDPQATPAARAAAGVVAALALSSLGLQIGTEWWTSWAGRGLLPLLWERYRFFTIITNTLVLLLAAGVAATGRWPGASLPAGLVVWIGAVGIVYHLLLAATHDPEGLLAIANQGLHTAVPLAYVLLWARWAPKEPLGWGQPALWSLFPLGYVGYAMARGAADGVYPYFFLDPGRIGPTGVLAYVAGLGAAFLCAGALVVAAARWRRKGQGVSRG